MNIQPGYDPEKKRVTLSIDSYLLSKYFQNFSGMIKENPGIPSGTEVEQINETVAVISFPIDGKSVISRSAGPNSQMMSIGIDSSSMEVFQKVINSFVGCAIRKELKTTEFIPLYGYPKEELKKDIQAAVENKRKLCIIQDFSEYKAMSEERKYVFHQYLIEPKNAEYTEAAILLYNEDIEKLRETFESKLKLESWC